MCRPRGVRTSTRREISSSGDGYLLADPDVGGGGVIGGGEAHAVGDNNAACNKYTELALRAPVPHPRPDGFRKTSPDRV